MKIWKIPGAAALIVAAMIAGCGGSGQQNTASLLATSTASVSNPATAYYNAVQQLYIAYFGRPADSGGLANFSAELSTIGAPTDIASISAAYSTNATIRTLVDAFGTSAESNALYTGTTSQFVTAIYTNIFNRGPDQEGLQFWSNAIDHGGLSKGNAALSIMAGALSNTTPQGLLDASAVTNKTTVAGNFTTAVNADGAVDSYKGDAAAATARTMLSAVGSSTDTVAFQATITTTINTLVANTVPGAPTIGTATAGNASASIAFTAPASSGGSAITSYTATCTGGGASKTGTGTASPITVSSLTNGTTYSCSVTATNAIGTGAASGTASVTPAATTGTTSTSSVYCPYSQSVYNSIVKLTNTVSITCSSTLRTITGNGVPDHTVGTFPNSGNPTAIGAVNVMYSNTLTPVYKGTSTSVAHKVGYANNSVPFDPATAESYQNAGVWKIEALNQTYFPFGTDSSNAHVQPDGTYHYHGMPEGYITKLGKGTSTMTLVGFALDGFPIYARYGYTTATDATSGVRKMNSSYRMKTTPDSGRPSTSTVPMGTFTQDYEYVEGLGDLDECNGRFGVTPEFPNGIYHYYITDAYPYIQRCVKGTPSYNGTIGN
jgi:hypothetical protein